ncbi:MAG TPA: hypothetical protein DEP72_04235 [Clostridiales bacterium]|nr:MAG: hypothetical protein A2Y18_04885 [Clostridiales bacterium GWD2_32_19]HCC07349.1 hypothetical protein [Clostridiales bacterium]
MLVTGIISYLIIMYVYKSFATKTEGKYNSIIKLKNRLLNFNIVLVVMFIKIFLILNTYSEYTFLNRVTMSLIQLACLIALAFSSELFYIINKDVHFTKGFKIYYVILIIVGMLSFFMGNTSYIIENTFIGEYNQDKIFREYLKNKYNDNDYKMVDYKYEYRQTGYGFFNSRIQKSVKTKKALYMKDDSYDKQFYIESIDNKINDYYQDLNIRSKVKSVEMKVRPENKLNGQKINADSYSSNYKVYTVGVLHPNNKYNYKEEIKKDYEIFKEFKDICRNEKLMSYDQYNIVHIVYDGNVDNLKIRYKPISSRMSGYGITISTCVKYISDTYSIEKEDFASINTFGDFVRITERAFKEDMYKNDIIIDLNGGNIKNGEKEAKVQSIIRNDNVFINLDRLDWSYIFGIQHSTAEFATDSVVKTFKGVHCIDGKKRDVIMKGISKKHITEENEGDFMPVDEFKVFGYKINWDKDKGVVTLTPQNLR